MRRAHGRLRASLHLRENHSISMSRRQSLTAIAAVTVLAGFASGASA
jgi:hypothetical protein